MATINTRDMSWIRRAFIIPDKDSESDMLARRYFSTASLKFTDTSLGGNTVINPLYQFTESADVPVPGRYIPETADPNMQGQGPYYSEAYDDNMQQVHCRMGVAAHNSLTRFFGNLYDSDAGRLARTGRTFDPSFLLGRAAGFVVSIIYWPIMAVQLVSMAVRSVMNHPTTKFYYLKPTMPIYWNAVTYIVNQITVNRGIVPRVMSSAESAEMGERNYGYTTEEMERFSRLLPDIFSADGTVNVYAVANRAQRLARQMYKRMEDAHRSNTSMLDAIKEIYETPLRDVQTKPLLPTGENAELDSSYMGMYFKGGGGNANKSTSQGATEASYEAITLGGAVQKAQENSSEEGGGGNTGQSPPTLIPDQTGRTNSGEYEMLPEPVYDENGNETGSRYETLDGLSTFFAAEMDAGAAFFSFRPDYAGAIGESFSSSFGQSEIQRNINDLSSRARSARFNFADGNINGLIGGVVDAVKGFAMGMVEQVNVQGLAVLAGNAFVDIAQTWESSIANLPTMSYTIRLGGPYGNKISQLMDIDIPLACFLAMALPRSTGPQSWTSPFLLEFYDRGRGQSRLAAVSALSIQRGVGNMGFSSDWRAMAVEVSLTLMPLDSIVSMPITTGISFNPAKILFTEDTAFTDYLNVLSAMGMQDQIYYTNRWKLNFTKAMQNFDTFFSAAHFASFSADIFPMRVAGQILRGTGIWGLNGSIRN